MMLALTTGSSGAAGGGSKTLCRLTGESLAMKWSTAEIAREEVLALHALFRARPGFSWILRCAAQRLRQLRSRISLTSAYLLMRGLLPVIQLLRIFGVAAQQSGWWNVQDTARRAGGPSQEVP